MEVSKRLGPTGRREVVPVEGKQIAPHINYVLHFHILDEGLLGTAFVIQTDHPAFLPPLLSNPWEQVCIRRAVQPAVLRLSFGISNLHPDRQSLAYTQPVHRASPTTPVLRRAPIRETLMG